MVAFGAAPAGKVVFGEVTSGAALSGDVAFDAGLSDVVAVDEVPAGGVVFGAVGVCTPWEKAGIAVERNNNGTATRSSLGI